jgi:hypothetical protein
VRSTYHWVTAAALKAYREQLEHDKKSIASEYAWLAEYLDLWARWHAGDFLTGGGGGMMPAYNENHDMPKCTATDVNGTAFEDLMLDIESGYNKLPGLLQQPLFTFYRKDMGRAASAAACGLSVRGFDGRLNLAYHHLAQHLNAR